MHMPVSKVYIVILNYRHWEDARDCLDSVLQSDYPGYSVFLIDNHSGNQSIEKIAAWLAGTGRAGQQVITGSDLLQRTGLPEYPGVTFVQHDRNDGFAAGNNLVLRLLKEEDAYVWLLNPDMTIEKDTLRRLVQFMGTRPEKTIAGAQVRSWSDNQRVLFYGGGRVNRWSGTVQMIRHPKKIHKLDYISGGSLFVHARQVTALGLLPETYFLYWEETDWCYRAKLKGYRLAVCEDALCYDKISTVIGKHYLAHYYYVRNGLQFISRFHRGMIPVALFFAGLRFLKRVVTGQWGQARGVWRGVLDFIKNRHGRYQ